MDNLVGNEFFELSGGWASFNCDLCELWYDTTEIGFVQEPDIEICNECVEYIGGFVEGEYDDD